MRTLKWIFYEWVNFQQLKIVNKPDFYMKFPVKLIRNEKVGQITITEFCVKFFGRRWSATKYENITVTSSKASQSLHTNEKRKLRITSTFNLVILNFIKISRVLKFAIWGDDILRGFNFSISKGKYKKGALNFKTQTFSVSFRFSTCELLTAARDTS